MRGRLVRRVMSQRGWYRRSDGRTVPFASKFERGWMEFLDLLLAGGELQAWDYEPQEFWFEAIKRGVRSYRPDFRLIYRGGAVVWQETKGHLDARSVTKIRRFCKYYPGERLELVMQAMPQRRTRQGRAVAAYARIEALRPRLESNGGRIIDGGEVLRRLAGRK